MRPLLCANTEQIMGDTEVELSQSRLPGPYPHRMGGSSVDAAPKSGFPSPQLG